jgi:CRP-like cAMP-binding protein
MSNVDIEILEQVFPQLSPDSVESLYNTARIVDYPAHTALCHEGAREGIFYIILDGEVEIYKDFAGEPKLLDRKARGEYFGEIALVLDEPRSADTITVVNTRVIEIDQNLFDDYIASNAEVILALTRLTMRQIRYHEERLLAHLAEQQKDPPGLRNVFVSYAREDQEFVLRLAQDIFREGIDVWMDQLNIALGSSWAREVGKALDTCNTMLLVLSAASLASTNVEDEWNYFLDKGKWIVPVLLEECDIPFRLTRIHYLDFVNTSYDVALARLVSALRFTAGANK